VQGFHIVKFPLFEGHGAGLLGRILIPHLGAGPSTEVSNLDLVHRIGIIAEVELSFIVTCNIEGIVACHRRRDVR